VPTASPQAGPPPRPLARPDLRTQLRRYPASFTLIGITAAVFAAQEVSLLAFGLDLPGGLGAKVNQAILAGQVWRFVTPMFLHGSLLHLFVNMYSLYALGPAIERLFGWRRMLSVYLVSGVAGVDFSLAFNRADSLGASGAIFGLLGALGAFLFLHRASLGRSGQIHFRQIVLVALLNLALGLSPGIDNWAHLGGLASGAALAFLLGPRFDVSFGEDGRIHLLDRRPWDQMGRQRALAVVAVVALSLAAVLLRQMA
jgi:rhomboid protease GluP